MANNLIFIIMDSCRYDSFVRAHTPNMDAIGEAQCRWSYASWTAPSHYAFLMGLMPHESPKNVYASEVYKKQFIEWVDRLGVSDLSFKTFLPQLSLPKVLNGLNYRSVGKVSMPVLNGFTLLNNHFDDYKLMNDHNNFGGMINEIEFSADQPHFYFLNIGETHYPYMLPGENLPHISGVHGVFKGLAKAESAEEIATSGHADFFDQKTMNDLHQQQVRCVEHIDNLLGSLIEKCPKNTHFIITADHGELFGEDGYFGHGPIMHSKCFEVPFIEGKRP
ncbi:MAG: sulfatase-like hydrolase/transferase [Gammaproteobacteria bacterium]|nr:sulfatase-like hydrolase/transferase [Gammaproteobacteria bacterium]